VAATKWTRTERGVVGERPESTIPDELTSLRALVEHSTDMLARHAPDGTFRYASPACRQLLGYEPEELLGRSAYELVHPEDLDTVRGRHEEVLAESRLTDVVYRIRRADGTYAWFETTGHTVRDPDSGEIVEIQTSSRDVSRRKQVEAKLRESEQRFRLAMTNAPIGMALVGLDGSWIEVNDRVCEILQRPREELLGLTFQDITHPEDLDTDLGYAQQLLEGEIAHYEMDKRYLRPSGEIVWALLSGSIVRDDDGEPLYYIAQIVDISLRKRALHELEVTSRSLERSNAELQHYASVAAHDLRSPLATLSGFLELLAHRFEDRLDAQGVQILQVARRVTMQLAETVEGLLQLAQVGQDELAHELVDTGAVVGEVIESLGPTLTASGADLHVGALPKVYGNRAQLRLLFQNLLVNAVKFRDPERRLIVTIDSEPAPPWWRFTVTDTGPGVAPADHEVIFEPFGRTQQGHRVDGAGIGLATCKRIVERHGGSIGVEAAAPGACFWFTLRAVPPEDGPEEDGPEGDGP
jgi:PAS domain S-box-containing protein